MAIVVTCGCGKRLKAPDSMAGLRAKCPACGNPVRVPLIEVQASDEPQPEARAAEADIFRFADEPKPTPPDRCPVEDDEPIEKPAIRKSQRRARAKAALRRPAAATTSPGGIVQHLHWLLVLALIPLAFSLLRPKERADDLGKRLERTLERYEPDVRQQVEHKLDARLQEHDGRIEELTADDVLVFPEGKLAGAHLPRRSWMHWVYAAGAAALFLGFLLLISPNQGVNPASMLAVGLFTATIGILFLVIVQGIAALTEGRLLFGRSIIVIIFYIAKLIAFSYRAALDPNTNFFLSFLGFTLGVGLLEELCKALPLLWHFRRDGSLSWRWAFMWGLASGAGFGISEGIMYAGSFYNGVAPANTYAVRFISCVALHALWSGSVGITLYKCQELIQQDMDWYEIFPPLFRILGVAMVLHGLYDTLLKKELDALALVVAVASFGWVAWQVWHISGAEEEPSPAALPA